MKRLRVVAALALASVLLCAGLVSVLLSVLRPERAPPELGQERPRAQRVVRQATAAADEGCRVAVSVRGPGGPLPDALVQVRAESGPYARRWREQARLDSDGRGVASIPCGAGFVVDASAEGHAPTHEWFPEDPEQREGSRREVEIELLAGVRLYGRVTDTDGAVVVDTLVQAGGAEAFADADGAYALWAPTTARVAWAEAFGHESEVKQLELEAAALPSEGLRVDFVLTPRRELRVWCAGLPDDACGDVPMQCTHPLSPVGNRCAFDEETGETRCTCPEGSDEVAVRGGGRAVLVDADAREAWLDFRDSGVIVGRVTVDGVPAAWCDVMAFRVPEALEDLPRGLVAGRRANCDADGAFRLDGVVPGDWEVAVKGRSETSDTHDRILVPRTVRRGATVDVGTVALPGGGTIEGTLVDGLTGQPKDDGPVVAIRQGDNGGRSTFIGDESGEDGRFRITGLPAGTWTVAYVLAPQDGVTAHVREGHTAYVELVTSDATALEDNGFALQDDEGALVVSDVTPDTPAYDAGLEPGEEVVGVLVGGFDITAMGGTHANEIARAVLGHYDGPGVTLVVRNPDGQEEEVPLDW